jgi:anti-sigma regulatory factor (Ser/Thr protein kinase)
MQPASIDLPGETSSVPPARRFVEQTLAEWDLDELAWTATLLVSELAANACLHAGTRLTITLNRTATRGVRLEVRDDSLVLPRMRRHTEQSTTGRGLRLVGDLAQRWGVDQLAGGKVVWAELTAGGDAGRGTPDEADADLGVEQLLTLFPDEPDVAEPRSRPSGRRVQRAA